MTEMTDPTDTAASTGTAAATAATAAGTANTADTAASLTLRHVTMVRRGLTLVEDLSLAVGPGQVLAVTGPSGAGKTTLLRAISGLSPTDGGTVARPGGRLSQVFQEPRLLPWYSAHRNISLIVDGPAPDPVAAQWLERVGLAGAGHLPRHGCPAACAKGWPSPGPWPPHRRSCSSMSPSPPWIARWPPLCAPT